MRVPHDLPLTVNDSVLQYLSYFSTTQGPRDCGAWHRPFGPLQRT